MERRDTGVLEFWLYPRVGIGNASECFPVFSFMLSADGIIDYPLLHSVYAFSVKP